MGLGISDSELDAVIRVDCEIHLILVDLGRQKGDEDRKVEQQTARKNDGVGRSM